MEATSASQKYLVFSIFFAVHIGNREEWGVGICLTYSQRLKQLGFSLDTLGDAEPAIFRWASLLLEELSRSSLGLIRSTLQIVLSFGADINARWCGDPLLICLFLELRRIDEESKTTMMTEIVIALLESGIDFLALSETGWSVFDAAEYNGWIPELVLALQETGYDFDEVRHKIRLAQWRLRNPGHSLAESTAVDHSQIEPPSKAGLVSRRAIAGDRLEE